MHRIAQVALLLAAPLFAFAGADVGVYPLSALYADPAAPFRFRVHYLNSSTEDAHDVTISVHLPPEVLFVRASFPCSVQGGTLICALGTVPARTNPGYLHLDLMIPPHFEGDEYDIVAEISAAGEDPYPRNNRASTHVWVYPTFPVTNMNDAGMGSLRQAILDANSADCPYFQPCKIAFRIPTPPERGWHTIQPLSPLPVITADPFIVDGTLQTWLTGDTNPLGPEIELNGALAGGANGLVIDTKYDLSIQGLCINGWAGNGIEFVAQTRPEQSFFNRRFVTGNYIGTEPTGTTAVPNGWRGISVFGHGAHIVGNVISGNLRSGIFYWSNSGELPYEPLIRNNRIGVRAHGDDALPNGASGILLGPEARSVSVAENVIAHNAEYGIAVAGLFRNELRRNRIFANGRAAIDIGLDGDTPVVRGEIPTVATAVLTSARYDAATNTTIIEGHPAADVGPFGTIVELFASDTRRADGRGEAERLLTEVRTVKTPFTITVPGDLRGSDITATITRTEMIVTYPPEGNPIINLAYQTSELSAPITVR